MEPGYPPLLGDGTGRFRVKITGNSGAGKTTVAKTLATTLQVPYISLDKLFWKPGWQPTPIEEFRAKVREELHQNERGWVVDGDYLRRVGEIVESEATDIIWLDPPLLLYFPRLFFRSLLRILSFGNECSPGCQETLRSVFLSKDSVLWWCLTHHWACRKRNGDRMRVLGLGRGEGGKMRRIGGWGRELGVWLMEIKKNFAR